jgi:hypothetical protein
VKLDKPKFWFPAKRYGWGWGPPNCWHGWAVMAVWVALLGGGGFYLMPNTGLFVAYAVLLAIVLTIVCFLKGEKPRWRWGKS